MKTFETPEQKQHFENILGNGENTGNPHFLLYLQCFLPAPKQFQAYSLIYFVWIGLKFCGLIRSSTKRKQKTIWNIEENRENVDNQDSLLFP